MSALPSAADMLIVGINANSGHETAARYTAGLVPAAALTTKGLE